MKERGLSRWETFSFVYLEMVTLGVVEASRGWRIAAGVTLLAWMLCEIARQNRAHLRDKLMRWRSKATRYTAAPVDAAEADEDDSTYGCDICGKRADWDSEIEWITSSYGVCRECYNKLTDAELEDMRRRYD